MQNSEDKTIAKKPNLYKAPFLTSYYKMKTLDIISKASIIFIEARMSALSSIKYDVGQF